MTWFRRGRAGPVPRPPDVSTQPPDPDSPQALHTALLGLVRYINRNAGRLPGEAVVLARRITDSMAEIIATSDVRPLDVYSVVSIRGTIDDYLPTTLGSYLAVDDHLLQTPLPSGGLPVDALLEQLAVLDDSATVALDAARNQDINALTTQGNFLRTKYGRSDLDL